MARISKYISDSTVQGDDRLIGSNIDGVTKNFAVEDIAAFAANTNAAGVIGQIPYRFLNSDLGGESIQPEGTIVSTVLVDESIFFDSISELKFNIYPRGYSNDALSLISSFAGASIIIADNEDPDAYAIYACTAVTVDPTNSDLYDLALTYVSGDGSMVDGSFYSTALYQQDVSAAGSDTQIQFNDGGAFGASSGLTYVSGTLSVGAAGVGGKLQLLRPSNGSNMGYFGAQNSGALLGLEYNFSKSHLWFDNAVRSVTLGNGATSLGAALGVKGRGITSATTNLLLQNSSGTDLLKVTDDGNLLLDEGVLVALNNNNYIDSLRTTREFSWYQPIQSTDGLLSSVGGTLSGSSSDSWGLLINHTVNQTGTSQYATFFAYVTETSTGSGDSLFFRGAVGGVDKTKLYSDGGAYFAGNVGIGTTSPTEALTFANNYKVTWEAAVSGNAKIYQSTSDNLVFLHSNTSKNISYIFGTTEYYRLTDDYASFKEDVIIGSTPTIPSARLHVKGSGTTSATTSLLVENSSGDDLLKIRDSGEFDFRIPNASGYGYIKNISEKNLFTFKNDGNRGLLKIHNGSREIEIFEQGTTAWIKTNIGSMQLRAATDTIMHSQSGDNIFRPNGTETARFTSTGLGIGTTSPTFPLDVVANGNMLRLKQSTSSNVLEFNVSGRSYIKWVGSSGALYLSGRGNGLFIGGASTDASARLHVKGSGATSATTSLLVENSSGEGSFSILDDKSVILGASSKTGTSKVTVYDNTYNFIDFRRNSPNDLSVLKIHSGVDFRSTYFSTEGYKWLNYYRTDEILILNSPDVTDSIADNNGGNTQSNVLMGNTTIYPNDGVTSSYIDFWSERGSSGFETPRARILVENGTGDRSGLMKLQVSADAVGFGDMKDNIVLTQSGNVGMGTTSPTSKLHVKGSGSTSATTSLLVEDSAGDDLLKIRDDGYVTFGNTTSENQSYNFYSGDGNTLSLYSDGSGDSYSAFKMYINGGALGSVYSEISLNNSYSSNAYEGAAILLDTRSGIKPMRFMIKDGGSNPFEAMGIDTDGNVGIGEATPTSKLHVKGSGTTSATTALLVENSSGGDLLKVTDDGNTKIDNTTALAAMLTLTRSDVNKGIRWANYDGTTAAFNLEYSSDLSAWSSAFGVKPNTGDVVFNQGVGIGTTTPTTALDVVGSGTFSSKVNIGGSALTYALNVTGDITLTGTIRSGTANLLKMSGNETTLYGSSGNQSIKLRYADKGNGWASAVGFTMNNYGKVRIGKIETISVDNYQLWIQSSGATSATTALLVQNSSGTDLLKVTDDGRMDRTVNGNNSNMGNWTNTEANGWAAVTYINDLGSNFVFGVGGSTASNQANTAYAFARGASTDFVFGTNNIERLRILASNGNVGIGVHPSYKLQVSGDTFIGGGGNTNLYVWSETGGAGNSSVILGGNIAGGRQWDVSAEFGNKMLFQIEKRKGETQAETMLHLQGSYSNATEGKMGVFTTSPTARLHVKGSGTTSATTALLVENSSGTDLLKVTDDGVVDVAGGVLEIYGKRTIDRLSGSDIRYNYVAGSYNHVFYTNSGTARLMIANDGNVGIGTTTPTEKITIGATGVDNNILINQWAYFGQTANGYSTVIGNNAKAQDNTIKAVNTTIDGARALELNYSRGLCYYGNTNVTSGDTLTELFRINTSGNVGIGATTPTARLHVKGEGITSATTALLVENSSGTDLLKVTDDGSATIGISGGTTTPLTILGNSGVQATIGNGYFNSPSVISRYGFQSGTLTFYGQNNSDSAFKFSFPNSQSSNTTTTSMVELGGTYRNQSSFQFANLNISPTYNFNANTNSAAIARGIYYNPTITDIKVAKHYAIETVTGDVLFGTTSGNVGIGVTPITKLWVKTTDANTTSSIGFLNTNAATIGAFSDTGSTLEKLQFRASSYQFATGSVLIDGSGYGLTPSAKLHVKGSGITSATTNLLLQNSSGTDLFKVTDDGAATFSGNVGIGTTPSVNAYEVLMLQSAGTNSCFITMENNSSDVMKVGIDAFNSFIDFDNAFFLKKSGTTVATLTSTGLGIRTTPSAAYSLDVTGRAHVSQEIYCDDKFISYGALNGFESNYNETVKARLMTNGSFGWVGTETAHPFVFMAGYNVKAVLDTNGNLSIGNSATDMGARLGVKGSGITSATTALLVENSSGDDLLKVTDDGSAYFGGGVGVGTTTPTNFSGGSDDAVVHIKGVIADRPSLNIETDNVNAYFSVLDDATAANRWVYIGSDDEVGIRFVSNGVITTSYRDGYMGVNINNQTDAALYVRPVTGRTTDEVLRLVGDSGQTGNYLTVVDNGTTIASLTADGDLGIGLTTPISTLDNGGSEGKQHTTITATSYTADGDDNIVYVDDDTAGADVTITLPAAASSERRIYIIKKIGDTGDVIVDGNGSETIDGELTQTLKHQYDSITIHCTGATWFIL